MGSTQLTRESLNNLETQAKDLIVALSMLVDSNGIKIWTKPIQQPLCEAFQDLERVLSDQEKGINRYILVPQHEH